MKGPALSLFEALARDRPSVWAAYQAWKDAKTQAERLDRAHDLMAELEETDPELGRRWRDVLRELGWFRNAG